jgi:hypothetical protein
VRRGGDPAAVARDLAEGGRAAIKPRPTLVVDLPFGVPVNYGASPQGHELAARDGGAAPRLMGPAGSRPRRTGSPRARRAPSTWRISLASVDDRMRRRAAVRGTQFTQFTPMQIDPVNGWQEQAVAGAGVGAGGGGGSLSRSGRARTSRCLRRTAPGSTSTWRSPGPGSRRCTRSAGSGSATSRPWRSPGPAERKVLGWPKICMLAHAFLWEYSYRRLKLAQLLGQLGIVLTCGIVQGFCSPPPTARAGYHRERAVERPPRPCKNAEGEKIYGGERRGRANTPGGPGQYGGLQAQW